MSKSVHITDEQQILVTVKPTTANGQIRTIDNIEWVSSDASVASVEPLVYNEGDTEFSAYIVGESEGECTVSVTADADLTEAINQISEQINTTVTLAQASFFEVEVNNPVPKPKQLLPDFQSGTWVVQDYGFIHPGQTKACWQIDETGAKNIDSSILRNWLGFYLETPAEIGATYQVKVEVDYINTPTTDQYLTAAFSIPPSQTQGTLLSLSVDAGVYTANIVPAFAATVFFLEVGSNSGFGECHIKKVSLKKL